MSENAAPARQNPDRVIDGCLAPIHSPAIVSRCGGIPASVLNTCGHCGEFIVRVDGVWLAICQEESERLRKGVKR